MPDPLASVSRLGGSPAALRRADLLSGRILTSSRSPSLVPAAWLGKADSLEEKKHLWGSGKSQGRECVHRWWGEGCWTVREWAWFPAVRFGLLSYYYPHTAEGHSVLRRVLVLCSRADILLPGQLKGLVAGLHERMNSDQQFSKV